MTTVSIMPDVSNIRACTYIAHGLQHINRAIIASDPKKVSEHLATAARVIAPVALISHERAAKRIRSIKRLLNACNDKYLANNKLNTTMLDAAKLGLRQASDIIKYKLY